MWTQEDSGRVKTPLEPLVLGATLLLIPALIIQADVESGAWLTVAYIINWIVWSVFVVEFALIMIVADRKRAALRAHWLDLALILLTSPILSRFIAGLRLIRLARLLRLLRATTIVARALQAERSLASGIALRLVALITLFIVVIAGATEATFDSKDFPHFWDGVWWSTVTVTTVGYGDYVPRSVAGRLIGMVVMLVGIGFLSVLTATVASHFVKVDKTSESNEIIEALARIEAELTDVKSRLAATGS